tara:strand:- start:513 stop:2057 length:1545 start_codon:yes stop_codon:yes gene_type:complete
MTGGLIQLAAYGAQDIYLTGNPQITFFQMVYRKHTNFTIEAIEQTFIGNPDFGNRVDVQLTRNGDLLHRMYIEHSATIERSEAHDDKNIGIVEHYGHSLLREYEILIGGQRIDRHSSLWQRVRGDLNEENPDGYIDRVDLASDEGEHNGTQYQYMTGNSIAANTDSHSSTANQLASTGGSSFNGFTYTKGNTTSNIKAKIAINKIFIPLQLWFCRHHGLALPLVALQYHNVELIFKIEELKNLFRVCDNALFGGDGDAGGIVKASSLNVTALSNFRLWGDYIYLDTDERRRFAHEEHEYLIEQIQKAEYNVNLPNNNLELKFSHPTKEIIWVIQNNTVNSDIGNVYGGRNQGIDTDRGDWTASPVSVDDFKGKWLLKFNNHERFKERDTEYFTRVQINQHHTGYGSVPTAIATKSNLKSGKFRLSDSNSIAVYSFALKPEDHQPSGVCNLSRLDSVVLESIDLKVWAIGGGGSDGGSYITVGETGSTDLKLTIFAVNYNILRIMSGMGGLAYSN